MLRRIIESAERALLESYEIQKRALDNVYAPYRSAAARSEQEDADRLIGAARR
jgi:hypothetical protein